MTKFQKLSIATVAVLSVAPVWAVFEGSPTEVSDTHDLLLRAPNQSEAKLGAGLVRIPIDVDGTKYEVIVVQPGAPALTPVQRANAD